MKGFIASVARACGMRRRLKPALENRQTFWRIAEESLLEVLSELGMAGKAYTMFWAEGAITTWRILIVIDGFGTNLCEIYASPDSSEDEAREECRRQLREGIIRATQDSE